MPSQTTRVGPYGPAQPGINQSIKDATNLYNSGGLTYSPLGSSVAPLTGNLSDYWNLTANRAKAGSPLNAQAGDYLSDVLSGKYLTADAPGLSDVLSQTRDLVNANFAGGGRYGSGVHDAALTSALGGLQFQNYQNERGIQNSAAQLAPDIAAQDYFDLGQLGQVGNQQQAYQQTLTSDQMAQKLQEQQKQAQALALYQQLLGGINGSVTTGPGAANPASNVNPWLLSAGAATSLGGSFLGNPNAGGILDSIGSFF